MGVPFVYEVFVKNERLIFSARVASPMPAHQRGLVPENVQLPQLRRTFSDRAKVILTGAALGSVLR